MTTRRANAVLLGVLGVIGFVTLTPSGSAHAMRIDACLLCGQNGAASALLNVLLFMPLGVALWWRLRSLPLLIAMGVLASLGIEALQLVIPGRHTALSDLLANGLGATIGGVLAIRPRAWLLPQGAPARAAALLVALGSCGLMTLAGALLRPSAPSGDYYGQWSDSGPAPEEFSGTVLEARLLETALPSARLDAPERIRDLIRGRSPVFVRFVMGEPTTTLSAVFRIVAGPYDAGTEVLQVGVDGTSLVLTPRFVADDYRVARPEVQLEDALAGFDAKDTVALTFVARADHGYDVGVGSAPPVLVGFTVGRGWSLFYATFIRSERALRLIDAVWIFALAACLGWFATGRGDRTVGIMAMATSAASTPLWSDLLPTPVVIYVALAVGCAAGMLLRAAVTSVQRRDGAHTS